MLLMRVVELSQQILWNGFLVVRAPDIRARVALNVAGCVESVVAHFALQDVVLFLYVLRAPWAEVIIHERTLPLVTMELTMSVMEGQITASAMFSDDFRNYPVAV